MTARSWAAQLDAKSVDRECLRQVASRVRAVGVARELADGDVAAILELDEAAAGDHPGGMATSHRQLTARSARPTRHRRAFGVLGSGGALLAMTFVDVGSAVAEVDFTVVAAAWRGQGVGSGLKAASVLALLDDGVESIRTGGSADNDAILRANHTIGFTIDEHWVTLVAPSQQ